MRRAHTELDATLSWALALLVSLQAASPVSIVGAVQASRPVPEGRQMDGPYRLLSSILHTVSSGGGMAPFNASIWDLIHEGAWKYALTTFEKGRTFLLKRIVAVDGLNQGHNEGRAPATFAEQRTNLGRRLIEICLLGGTPVLFLDGQHASPGSGKYKQHAARAAVSPRFTGSSRFAPCLGRGNFKQTFNPTTYAPGCG